MSNRSFICTVAGTVDDPKGGAGVIVLSEILDEPARDLVADTAVLIERLDGTTRLANVDAVDLGRPTIPRFSSHYLLGLLFRDLTKDELPVGSKIYRTLTS